MRRPVELRRQVEGLLNDSVDLPVNVVVADASPPGQKLELTHPRLTVLPLDVPSGVDRDYELAVEAASGEYCWLCTDDDEPSPGVCARVLEAISAERDRPSLVLLDAVVLSPSGETLRHSMLGANAPRRLEAGAPVEEFAPVSGLLTFIGSVVIKRAVWLSRTSNRFVGSEFRHVGLILEEPLPGSVIVIKDPLISIRYGVAHWEVRAVRVWLRQWPDLVRQVVPDRRFWPLFFPASMIKQTTDALMYRARNLLNRTNVNDCYPQRTSRFSRAVFNLVAILPPRWAELVLVGKARVRGADLTMIRFEIDRGRLRKR